MVIAGMTPAIHSLSDDLTNAAEVIALIAPFNEKVEHTRNQEYRARKMERANEIKDMVNESLKMKPQEFFKAYDSQLTPKKDLQP